MHTHQASCLRGPITHVREHWLTAELPVDDVPSLSDPDIRADLVRRVRREIANGTYDTPEKWEKALEQMREELE